MAKAFPCEYQTMKRVFHSVLTDVHIAWLQLLQQEVLFDESRKWTPGDCSFCFNGTFFHLTMQMFTVGVDPVSWRFFFFFFGSFSMSRLTSPRNAHERFEPRAGCWLYLAWSSALRCTRCLCPSSLELSKHMHFSDSVSFAFQSDTEGIKSPRKSHPC